MVSRLNAVSTLVLFTLLLKIALILFRLFVRRGRAYTAVETEETLSGLIRVLILLMSYTKKMYIEDSTIGVFAIAAIMLRIQSNLCLIYGNLDKEERNRYVTLNLIAGALCEFFGLMYLLDFVTSRQTESLSILQCVVPRMTSVHPTTPSVAPSTNSATSP